jgi:pimeloyl-ACP methyl ester carboxylesterase
MGANDWSTVPLRKLLQSLGYSTHGWRQGFNVGPRDGVLARGASDLTALARRHGRPVTLVGWSLGGLYARELAKVLPHCTRAVITLGTPFAGHPRATNAWRVFEFLSGQSSHDPAMIARLREPPPVPTTSLYSRTDGVVAWQCSLNEPGPMAENIEVPASHTGMGVSPLALYVLAERLAQPRERWKPFVARGAGRWVFRTDAAPAPAVGR